jgi:hypothetical protein
MARVMAASAASRAFSWATRLVFFRTLDFSPPGRSCPPSSRWVTRCQGSRSDRPKAGLPLTSCDPPATRRSERPGGDHHDLAEPDLCPGRCPGRCPWPLPRTLRLQTAADPDPDPENAYPPRLPLISGARRGGPGSRSGRGAWDAFDHGLGESAGGDEGLAGNW